MAGLSLSLLLVVGLAAWRAVEDRAYVAPRPDAPVTAAPAAATETLRDLERAIGDGDVGEARDLAPPGDEAAARLLGAVATTAREARVVDLSFRYVTELSGVGDDGTWSASVDATWAFRGFDPGPALTEVRMDFRREGDRVFVAAIGGGDRRTPVWLSGPAEVRRSDTALVVARTGPAEADRLARVARAAVPVVAKVLPDAATRLVVEVPATGEDLHRALDAEPGTYDSIAAVTTSVDGSLSTSSPVHVFVNPEVFGGLQLRGAQVVMSHEAVHVATGAAVGDTLPLWLLEGFADYVALRDVPLPLEVAAGQVIREVRRDGPPEALPSEEQFDTRTAGLGASYEAAWLACRLLAQREGDAALVRFYEAVDSGTPLPRALRREYGWGVGELTRAWQALLTDLAA